jgi:hypothetical protein
VSFSDGEEVATETHGHEYNLHGVVWLADYPVGQCLPYFAWQAAMPAEKQSHSRTSLSLVSLVGVMVWKAPLMPCSPSR